MRIRGRTTLLAVGMALTLSPLPGAAQSPAPNPTHRVHMQSKPAVVKIIAGFTGKWAVGGRVLSTSIGGTGSGFIISQDGYILTNAHVVSDIREGDEKGKQQLLRTLAAQLLRNSKNEVNAENMRKAIDFLVKEGARLAEFKRVNYVVLQSGSRYPFEIKAYGAPLGEGVDLAAGKDVAVLKIEVRNAPTLRLANSDVVQVGDRIYVMGYPGAAELGGLGDQKSMLEPTTNDGAISARKTSVDGAPIFQTNTNTAGGNSGGPAINEKGDVVGLLTAGSTKAQGFNFLVPANTAMEFVRQAGVDLKPGSIDQRWQQGLEHYWKQEYSLAKEKFTQVLVLHPDHALARQLVGEAEERIVRGEDRSGFSLVQIAGIGVAATGTVALIVIVVVLLARRKKTPAIAASVLPAAMSAPASGTAIGAARSAAAPPPAAAEADATAVYVGTKSGKLVCISGPLEGKEFAIGDGVIVGRDGKRSQVVVADAEISGQHVWVGWAGGKVIARECGSTNGTFLNADLQRRITEVPLADGDVLTLGRRGAVKFSYRN
ncbi:MAG TPA: trypsin-like peptidase domain-containing protein [Burkholderiales bacterium]|nr:trypsin-like peptidase domain-containing protein [Burkholderiales bacterium]